MLMKKIGIAAVSAEGAAACYKKIAMYAGEKLGAKEHPEILLDNPSFARIFAAQEKRDWQTMADIISGAVNRVADAGAEFAIVPSNSAHFAYKQIEAAAKIPVLNLVELAAEACEGHEFDRVAVLGVGVTMSDGLYDNALQSRGIRSIKLPDSERKKLNEIIYEELVYGEIVPDSVSVVIKICERLMHRGCKGILMACTELPLIINGANSPLPFIDTNDLLAEKTVEHSLA
jgi:aspartate racemase